MMSTRRLLNMEQFPLGRLRDIGEWIATTELALAELPPSAGKDRAEKSLLAIASVLTYIATAAEAIEGYEPLDWRCMDDEDIGRLGSAEMMACLLQKALLMHADDPEPRMAFNMTEREMVDAEYEDDEEYDE